MVIGVFSMSHCKTVFLEVVQNEIQRTQRQSNNSPPADPAYDFSFKTPEYQRREKSDNLGRVKGNLKLHYISPTYRIMTFNNYFGKKIKIYSSRFIFVHR